MSLLENVQTFLVARPEFPQKHFDGQHELDIQILDSDHDYSQEEINEIVEAILETDDVAKVLSATCDLCRDRINVLTGNAARAEKTRSPQVSSTQSKGWKAAIKSGNHAQAKVMYDAFVQTADIFGVTDMQLSKLHAELVAIRPIEPTDES